MTAAAVAVRERPLLMSGPMVRAILDGKKSQTRRVMKPITGESYGSHSTWLTPLPTCDVVRDLHLKSLLARCPYGVVGERLWVRERHAVLDMTTDTSDPDAARPSSPWQAAVTTPDGDEWYVSPIDASEWRASFDNDHAIWRPSIHMPRWASRLTLELTDVRVERLQAITYADVIAEGCPSDGALLASPADFDWYRKLWESLNAKRGYPWAANPWVWTLSFRRVDA